MIHRCVQCLQVVDEERGYESPRGDLLCGSCYFALWGPRGASRFSRETEARRPRSTAPPKGRPIWLPGPTGELDPEARRRRRS